VSQQQIVIDQLTEDVHNARRLVEKSRPTHRGPHTDLERLEADVGRLTNRWENVCEQLVDRYESFTRVCDHLKPNHISFFES
jgi:hypothetical protein